MLQAKGDDGLPLDPVARFHLSNGARLERVNPGADESERGMAASAGLMVNYVYEPGGGRGQQGGILPQRQRSRVTQGAGAGGVNTAITGLYRYPVKDLSAELLRSA